MHLYELVFLTRQDTDPGKILDGVLTFGDLHEQDLKILKKEPWGIRKLAYPISGEKYAFYTLLGLECTPFTLSKITKRVRDFPVEILRHLAIRVDEISDQKSPLLDYVTEEKFGPRKSRPVSSAY